LKFITTLENTTFESSSMETQQFKTFYGLATREIKKMLKDYTKEVKFSKGHFYFSGFIRMNDDRIFYLSIPDVRSNKGPMLVRTAKSFQDYSGGSNGFVRLDDNFEESLLSTVNN